MKVGSTLTIRRIAFIGFCVAALASLLVGALACRNAVMSPANLTEVSKSFRIIADLNNLLILTTAAENETRGYLFSGDPQYREMALQSADASVVMLKELEPIVLAFPTQAERLRKLEPLIYEHVQFLEHCLQIRGMGGLSAALNTFQRSYTLKNSENLQQTIRSMISEQTRIQMQIRQEADQSSVRTILVVVMANVLNLMVVAAALFLIRQAAIRLQSVEKSLRINQTHLEEANSRLQRLASEDALTGIANRRTFDVHLAEEWKRAARNKSPLSLILLDVDYFKNFNDTLGHPKGDDCLVRVARVLMGYSRRPADLVARYGGEEFAILLPETDSHGAHRLAEMIREGVSQLKIENPGTPLGHLTVSLGVAGAQPRPGFNAAELVHAADRELYHAKDQGRNQTSVRELIEQEREGSMS